MAEETEAQVIVETAQAAAAPHELDTEVIHSLVVPVGYQHVVFDPEAYLPAPRSRRGSVTVFTASALGEYTERYKTTGTVLYADVVARSITAVLNDHQPLGPPDSVTAAGWADHRATLQLRPDPSWTRWTAQDNKLMDQVAFAELIETGFEDIVSPPAADMLELAQTLQAHTKAEFRSQQLLASGQRQLRYEETVDAKAGQSGQLEVPTEFVLGLIPFEGCDPYKVTAHLRLRLSEGHLAIGYVLHRPEDVLRAAFADILGTVEAATETLALAGTAPSPRR